MEEQFKDIPNYEGHYQAGNKGNIRSLKRKRYILLKGGVDKMGYKIVTLLKDKNQSTKTVHRLIAITWIENPENKLTVNHIDGVKLHNEVENLEWNTYQENLLHAFRIGLNKSNRKVSVCQIDENNVVINTFSSLKEAWKTTGIRSSSICLCLNGTYKKAGNFKWVKNLKI